MGLGMERMGLPYRSLLAGVVIVWGSLLSVIGPVTADASEQATATTVRQVLAGVTDTASAEVAAALTQVAVAELDQSRSSQAPVVTIDAQDELAGDPVSSEPEAILRVEQMLLDWGRSDGDVSGRESALEARKSAEREAVLDAGLQSIEAFYGIGAIKQKIAANEENRTALVELRDMMERRVANDVSPSIDLHEVATRLDLLDIADHRLGADRRKLQLTLIRLAGVNVEDPEIQDCERDAALDEERAVRDAISFSPTLDRIRHQAEAFVFDAAALEADRLPSLVAGYRADSRLDGNEFDQRAYLALRYELQTGGELEARRAAQHARQLEQRALLRRDAEVVTQTVGAWVSTYRTSVSLVEVYRRLVSAKVKQKESHLRRFLAGRSSWRDVLSAQQEVADARTARIDAASAVCLASTSLSLLTGGTGEL